MKKRTKAATTPKIGTIAEMASGTRLKATCHPPWAKVVTHIKNILALQINKKNILLYNNVPQNIACWCSSLLSPLVMKPIMKASNPAPINPIDQVLILPENSNCCSLIDAILNIFLAVYFSDYYFAAAVPADAGPVPFPVLSVAPDPDPSDPLAVCCFIFTYWATIHLCFLFNCDA